MTDYDPRPLLLLDVDGVVNDLPSVMGIQRPWPEERHPIGGIELAVPLHIPPLVEYLDLLCEIHWCTTWREMANQILPDLIGIGPYPVVGADDPADTWGWKSRCAAPIAEAALAAGRDVYWLEDFEEVLPEGMPEGVRYLDTAADGFYVLLPHHLPPELLPEGLRHLSEA